jgi:hypothetical protein
MVGAIMALALGPLLYYGFFNGRVSFDGVALIDSCTAIVGGIVSLTGCGQRAQVLKSRLFAHWPSRP